MFKKVLIANRGEIAVRIIRACREMGIKTVAIFSDIDRKALHVRLADEAYLVGPAQATQSYLNMEKIMEVAEKSGAEAIHPGYGFFAENYEFVKRVESEGLVFIGPPAEAVKLLGDKVAARKTMKGSGVPIVPGTEVEIGSEDQGASIAESVGFPILIKAVGGGGGKGMRIVRKKSELKSALRAASSEAKSAFADPRIYIEKYLERPRHVEIQILADRFGNVIHLGERECSIQRRHQKVVEESPSPVVDEKMRKAMGEAAVTATKATGYVNAGTIEFLVDADRNFYFLESNTRLQVEHPVTEMVTGIDIAKEQLKVACGMKLSYKQEDIRWRGSAIECRIYAEDPENNFLPSTGVVYSYWEPSGPGIRVDSGLYEGAEVSLFYDPLISKLLAWGKDREEAIQRMKRALFEYRISGVATTISFHLKVMENQKFQKGEIHTHFIEEEFEKEKLSEVEDRDELLKAVAVFSALLDYQEKKKIKPLLSKTKSKESPWKIAGRKMGLR
ncbi:MAG: acetyl-CoA carboxylase biotin carboxylase subunit [candidate division Zixibacteria bacterium]|nr:acetyl-CoA carboxylase biotin carboxylase subunit [candidate division Zixibacteria bacterium]